MTQQDFRAARQPAHDPSTAAPLAAVAPAQPARIARLLAGGPGPDHRRRCPDPARMLAIARAGGIDNLRVALPDLEYSVWHPRPSRPARKALFLIHGATHSTMTVYDIGVPGAARHEYSLLGRLAARGVAVFGIDLAGYGLSQGRSRPSTLTELCTDVAQVIGALSAAFDLQKRTVMGWSWSVQIAANCALRHPGDIDAAALISGVWGGGPGGWPEFLRFDAPKAPRRVNDDRAIEKNFERSPDLYAAPLLDAYRGHAHWLDPTSPNDPFLAYAGQAPLYDPARIAVPCLIGIGEREAERIAQYHDLCRTVPGAQPYMAEDSDHYIQYGPRRAEYAAVLADFATS